MPVFDDHHTLFLSSEYCFNENQDTASLIWEPADTPNVSNTPLSSGNRRTFTIHIDVQITKLNVYQSLFMVFGAANDSGVFNVYLDSSNRLGVGGNSTNWRISSEAFADTIGRTQITIAVDSTDGTANNRMRFYKGQREIVDFSTNNTIALNHDFAVNHTYEHRIGNSFGLGGAIFSGIYGSVSIIDGQQLTGSDFVDIDNRGVEIFSKYKGAYGTNGAFLDFNDASTQAALGTNSEGTDWSVSGVDVTESVESSWSNNFCTLNNLVRHPVGNLLGGNLEFTRGTTSSHGSTVGSIPVPPVGNWYWEVIAASSGAIEQIGIVNINNNPQIPPDGVEIGGGSRGDYSYRSDGNKYNDGNDGVYGATYVAGDVIGVLCNADAGTITFYKNGVSQGVAYTGIDFAAIDYFPGGSQAENSPTVYNFGQKDLSYPVTGAKSLNSANLPKPEITEGGKYFQILTWTGDGSTTGTRDITGDFTWIPEMFWEKSRNGVDSHRILDVVRGFDSALSPNLTSAETTIGGSSGYVTPISGGIRLDNTIATTLNANAVTYVAWCWKMGGTGVSNTDGTITSTVSANALAGMFVATWTGTGVAGTVGHGIGRTVDFFIGRSRAAAPWVVRHKDLNDGSVGDYYLELASTDGETNAGSSMWNGTDPTSDVFSIGVSSAINALGETYVGYGFAEIEGFSKFGSYTGNGSADGPFVYCGFAPRYILIKRTDSTGEWAIHDTERPGYNSLHSLYANSSAAEAANLVVNVTASGFKVVTTSSSWNTSGGNYIFATFAEYPFGGRCIAPAPAF